MSTGAPHCEPAVPSNDHHTAQEREREDREEEKAKHLNHNRSEGSERRYYSRDGTQMCRAK